MSMFVCVNQWRNNMNYLGYSFYIFSTSIHNLAYSTHKIALCTNRIMHIYSAYKPIIRNPQYTLLASVYTFPIKTYLLAATKQIQRFRVSCTRSYARAIAKEMKMKWAQGGPVQCDSFTAFTFYVTASRQRCSNAYMQIFIALPRTTCTSFLPRCLHMRANG